MRQAIFVMMLCFLGEQAYGTPLVINFDFVKKVQDVQLAGEWAIAALEADGRGQERSYRYHYVLGVLLADIGSARAVDEFKVAIALNPTHAPSMYNLAGLYMHAQNYDEGMAYYREALKNDNKLAPAYTGLATAYLLKRDIPNAYAALQEGLKSVPDDPDLLYNLSVMILYYYKNQYKNAILNLEKSLAKKPKNENYLLLRSAIYLQLKQYEKAGADCEDVIRINHENVTAYLIMMEVYRGLKKYDQALEVAAKLEEIIPYANGIKEEKAELRALMENHEGKEIHK